MLTNKQNKKMCVYKVLLLYKHTFGFQNYLFENNLIKSAFSQLLQKKSAANLKPEKHGIGH